MTGHVENLTKLKELVNLSSELFKKVQDLAAERLLPNRQIKVWLRAPKQRLLLTIISLLIVTSVAKAFLWGLGKVVQVPASVLGFALSQSAIYVVEAILVIFVGIYVTTRGGRDESSIQNAALTRALRAENRFFAYWPLLWMSWFVLYLMLAFNAFNPVSSPYFVVGLNFVNNLSGLFIFALFYELTERTTHPGSNQQLWMPMLMLLGALGVAEALCYAKGLNNLSYVFGLVSGLLVGVCTGLLVARLTSRLFNLHIFPLVMLTLFAIIQPVFPILTAQTDTVSQGIAYVAALIALYAKVALLIVIEWLRDRFGVLYYMVNAARLFDDERERHMSASFEVMIRALLQEGEAPPPAPESAQTTRTPSVH